MNAKKDWAGKVADPFETGSDDDGTYRAWRKAKQGWAKSLRIYPASGSGEKIRYIPYLQPITVELDPDSDQLCLICHSTDTLIFIKGRGLEEVAEAVDEKRAQSLHVYEPARDGSSVSEETCIINEITIETSYETDHEPANETK